MILLVVPVVLAIMIQNITDYRPRARLLKKF